MALRHPVETPTVARFGCSRKAFTPEGTKIEGRAARASGRFSLEGRNMKWKIALAAASLAATHGCAIGASREKPPPDAVLLENGAAKVTVQDFDAAMTRFPENIREEARAYPNIIIRNLDVLFVNRVAAQRAKAAGLDQDPLTQQRMVQLQ